MTPNCRLYGWNSPAKDLGNLLDRHSAESHARDKGIPLRKMRVSSSVRMRLRR